MRPHRGQRIAAGVRVALTGKGNFRSMKGAVVDPVKLVVCGQVHLRSGARTALPRLSLALALTLAAAQVGAQTPPGEPSPEARSAAAAAYQQGVRAFETSDFGAAAEFFETADRTAPAAQAAIYAIRAHRGANNAVHNARAATIALELLSRYPSDTRVTGYAYRVVDDLSPNLARLQVHCQGCDLSLDDQSSAHEVFTNPGHHSLVAAWGSRVLRREVDTPMGQTTRLDLAPPLTEIVRPPSNPVAPPVSNPTPVREPAPHSVEEPVSAAPSELPIDRPPPSGLSPAVFVTGTLLTLGLGGALTWSALNTLDGRDAYVANPTQAGLDDGRDREFRTNLLIGATAGVGVTTLIIGAFFTRWRSAPRVALSPLAVPDFRAEASPGLSLRGQF